LASDCNVPPASPSSSRLLLTGIDGNWAGAGRRYMLEVRKSLVARRPAQRGVCAERHACSGLGARSIDKMSSSCLLSGR
jgi:hypothetical protein